MQETTLKTAKKDYLPILNALRGIAAIWVVLFHMDVILFYREVGTLLPKEWSGLLTQGYLWVDFFFILSGFIITHVYREHFNLPFTYKPIKTYLIARFLRIYPLHLFTLIILIILTTLTAIILPSIIDDSWQLYFDWQAIISQIFLTNSMNQHTYLSWNIVSWSIGAEWWTYVAAIALLYSFSASPNSANKALKFKLLIITLFAITSLILLAYLHSNGSLDITFDYGFLRCLCEFTLGVVIHHLFRQQVAYQYLKHDRAILLTLITIICIFHFSLHDLLVVPLFSILILCSAYNHGKAYKILSSKLPQYLGKISYSIYMVHGIWFMVYWFAIPQFYSTEDHLILSFFETCIYALSFLIMTFISAAYTYKYIEIPGRFLYKNQKTQLNNILIKKKRTYEN